MTNKKPVSKKTPTKPKAQKPAVKKGATKTTSTETVRVQIPKETNEPIHTHAPVSIKIAVAPKKKSLWRRIFRFGF